MANEVTLFDPNGQLPAHVAAFLDENEGNITDRVSVPSLGYEGKVWQISVDGTKTKLMRRNADGDEEPVGTLPVVVLGYNPRRGRSYYEGEYDPAKISAPVCWSDDGIAPDATVPEHPSELLGRKPSKCAECPMSVKGSKITPQGKAVTACSQHRMLAVVPAHDLNFTPLRLKIAITSDFDKQSPDAQAQGWYAFSNYTDFLASRGVKHTGALVTKIKFDSTAAYPKLFFRADRYLSPEELAKVATVAKSDAVQELLSGTWTPAGADGVRKDTAAKNEAVESPVQAPATVRDPAQEQRAAVQDDDDDGGEIIMAGVTTPASQQVVDAVVEDVTPAATPKSVETPKATEMPDEVAKLLEAWGAAPK